MIKCFYDLHIHSALSPCASNDMTPNNIINMAILKGLDIIAVTDHNSAKNIGAILKVAKAKNIIVIPGIEVETYEGIHMLCLFRNLEDINIFDKLIYRNLPKVRNNENVFGEQIIFNEDDTYKCEEMQMLLNATCLKLNEVIKLVHLLNGLIFCAHIDRLKNSIITVLGFIPENLAVDGVEIISNNNQNIYDKQFKKYRIIQNSDAHYLGNIYEKMNNIYLQEKSINGFFDYFGGGK